MGFEWNWGHGKVLPEGYTVVGSMDFPVLEYNYYIWLHVKVKVFWFLSVNRRVAVLAY